VLFTNCAQLELSIRKKEFQKCTSLLTEVEKETKEICSFLRQHLDEFKVSLSITVTPGQQRDTATDTRHALIADLSDALTTNSSKALKQIHLLRAHLEQENDIVFARIEKHINDLDFAKAHLLLTQWQNSTLGMRDPK
jgi:hypothetical protein